MSETLKSWSSAMQTLCVCGHRFGLHHIADNACDVPECACACYKAQPSFSTDDLRNILAEVIELVLAGTPTTQVSALELTEAERTRLGRLYTLRNHLVWGQPK